MVVRATDIGKTVPTLDGQLTILDGIELEINVGESLAVVGASGSGKTTLIGILAGLDLPSRGQVHLAGHELTAMDEEERARVRGEHVGFVFQTFRLLASLTAVENVMLPAELRGDAGAESQARELLDRVGLADRATHYPRQLSGGEQQRVGIARAFASRPTVLFADEPHGQPGHPHGRPGHRAAVPAERGIRYHAGARHPRRPARGPVRPRGGTRCRKDRGMKCRARDLRRRAELTRPGRIVTPRIVTRMAWRDWRSGELGLLLLALLVAVGTVTAISLFVDRLHQALRLESASFLAADRYIGSTRPIPEEFRRAALARGLDTVDAMAFPSMVYGSGERSQLASVKAVGAGYPLRGELIVGDEPFGAGRVAERVPQSGEVWLDSRMFPALDLSLGDEVEVGLARLRVGRVLVKEPDRGGSFFDLGPRLLMNIADVPATEVVQPGSRIGYRLLLRGAEADLEALRGELELEPNYRWMDIRRNSRRIGGALDRAESFLLLGGLLGVLLAGVAVALSAHRYARRHYDHVGIFKTLGATPSQILNAYLGILGVVGGFSVLLGLALGAGLHLAIVAALDALIPVELPMPSARPFLLGAATGLICALAFAMPPLLHLKNISPLRVMRRDLGAPPVSQWLSYGAAGAGALLLLVWYSESLLLTLWTLAGTLVWWCWCSGGSRCCC